MCLELINLSKMTFILHIPRVLAGQLNPGERNAIGWGRGTLRKMPQYIRPHENTTLIEPTTLCKTSSPLLLLIVVCSAARHFDHR